MQLEIPSFRNVGRNSLAVQCVSGGAFTNPVTFFNQDTNDWETREMYVSDKTAGMFFRNLDGTGEVKGFKECRIALVEV